MSVCPFCADVMVVVVRGKCTAAWCDYFCETWQLCQNKTQDYYFLIKKKLLDLSILFKYFIFLTKQDESWFFLTFSLCTFTLYTPVFKLQCSIIFFFFCNYFLVTNVLYVRIFKCLQDFMFSYYLELLSKISNHAHLAFGETHFNLRKF